VSHWDNVKYHIILKRSKVDPSKHWFDDCIGPLLNPLMPPEARFSNDDLRDQEDTYILVGVKCSDEFSYYEDLVPSLADFIPDSYAAYLTSEHIWDGESVTPVDPLNLSHIEAIAICERQGVAGTSWRKVDE